MAVFALVRKSPDRRTFPREEPGAVASAANVEKHDGSTVSTTSAMMRSEQSSNYQATGLSANDDFTVFP